MTVASSNRAFAPAKLVVGTGVFHPPFRIQTSMLSPRERKLLDVLCQWLPNWVTPDLLTAIGVLGAVVAAAGYAASNLNSGFLFLASFGLILNWFGDSLDGSLARYRQTERHRYGFFLDHSMDAFSNLVITVGLGLSPYVGMDVALFTLVGYLMLGVFVILSNHVSGAFRLSFLGFGPTELRLLLVFLNLMMFVLGPIQLHVLGWAVSLHSVSVGALGVVLVSLFLVNVYLTATELARQG